MQHDAEFAKREKEARDSAASDLAAERRLDSALRDDFVAQVQACGAACAGTLRMHARVHARTHVRNHEFHASARIDTQHGDIRRSILSAASA